MISVLVLTKNEAHDLPGCLDSVAWSDDVHILDSFSTDDTVAIAEAHGAHVTQRRFDGYASQRNAGLALPFRHAWVLVLDADERVPTALVDELRRFAATAGPEVGAGRIRRRDFLNGRWLRHAQISPFYVRMLRRGSAHYEREVNEVVMVTGRIVDLQEPFDHHPFSKGMRHWLDKHNQYSTMEAELVLASRQTQAPFSIKTAFFGRDFNERRFHQKELFYRLPCRPLVKWVYMMVVRGAFRDGHAGWTYAWLQAIYEYMIVLKTRELEQQLAREARV